MNYSDFTQQYQSAPKNKKLYNERKYKTPDQSIPAFELYPIADLKKPKRKPRDSYARTATMGFETGIGGDTDNCDLNPVTELFYSEENMARLQRLIRREVQVRSQNRYRLDCDQDPLDLLVVMRAIYLGAGDSVGNRFLPNTGVVRQVKILNRTTVNYLIGDLMSNLQQEIGFQRDIASPRNIMPTPLNVSNAGRRVLPSVTSLWTR